jgi:hypothetical protein
MAERKMGFPMGVSSKFLSFSSLRNSPAKPLRKHLLMHRALTNKIFSGKKLSRDNYRHYAPPLKVIVSNTGVKLVSKETA